MFHLFTTTKIHALNLFKKMASSLELPVIKCLLWQQTMLYGVLNQIECQFIEYEHLENLPKSVEEIVAPAWSPNDDQKV